MGLRNLIEKRSLTDALSPYSIPSPASQGYAPTGMVVSEDTAMGLATVAACVRILSTSVSSLPLNGFTQSVGVFAKMEPQPQVLLDPFHGVTIEVGLTQIVASMAMRGNAYLVVTHRDGLMHPERVMIVHPDQVKVSQDRQTGLPIWKVAGQDVPREDMIHIPLLSLPGSPVGVSPLENHRNAFGLALATEAYGSRFFGAGAKSSGVIEIPDKLDPNEVRQIGGRFDAVHSGVANSHRTAVLSGGAKYTALSVTPEESQFLGTRAFQAGELAAVFGVPPHLIGQLDKTTSWGTGIESQGRAFVTYTLRAYLTKIEKAFSRMLPAGVEVRFDIDELIRPEMAIRYAGHQSALSNGWMSVNEVRQAEGLPPIDGGSVYRHPLNIGTDAVPTDPTQPDTSAPGGQS